MRANTWATVIVSGLVLGMVGASADAKRIRHRPFRPPPQTLPGDVAFRTAFAMLDMRGTSSASNGAISQSLSGSTIAAFDDKAIAIDEDSGTLVLAGLSGEAISTRMIGAGASQLVLDRERELAYVADRNGDRIAVVSIRKGLEVVREFQTAREPYGVALTPDRKTLLVTTVADRKLVAFDVASGAERWWLDIGPEARSVAINPNGRQAIITYLTTAAVGRVDLPIGKRSARLRFSSLNHPGRSLRAGASTTNDTKGRTFARNAFVATHLKNGSAVIPFQRSTPVQETQRESHGTYGGGGFNPPIVHRLAFVGESGRVARAHVNLHQPRAIAYNAESDTLYIAGFGSDSMLALADASEPSIHLAWQQQLRPKTAKRKAKIQRQQERCGPSGLTITDAGEVLAFCSMTRSIARITPPRGSASAASFKAGPELAPSRLSEAAQRGRELFHLGNDTRLSGQGALACASCHPEGRHDGLSWKIEGHVLQTPLVGGRLAGTHPFKWDGQDKNIQTSLTNTVRRLGGSGINTKQAGDLQAFLDSLAPPRAPTPKDHRAVARGKSLFHSRSVGCAKCHSGAQYTDGKLYDLAEDLKKVDTPSLVGLASSAPYYHDGSAKTLRALLLENGSIHGMGSVSKLKSPQLDDLVAYLETL